MSDPLVNMAAEQALVGAMMIQNGLIGELSDRVKPDDFGDKLHGRIYSAMLRFHARGMASTSITLRPVFINDGDARYGEYLDELVSVPAVVDAAESIADQVADLSRRRHVREAMQAASRALVEDLDRPVGEIAAQVERAAWSVDSARDTTPLDAAEMIGLVQKRRQRILDDPGAVGLTNHLIEDVDKGLGPIERGTYNIVAGRPGMGKSAFVSSLALGYAINGHCGLYLQHEMSNEQQSMRMLADLSHAMGLAIPHSNIRKNRLSDDELHAMDRVRDKAKILPLRYVAPGMIDVRKVYALVAQHKAMWEAQGRELEFVVIDYIGLLGATDEEGRPIEDDRKRVNAVSKMLKRIAEELNVAVFALAQLGRGVEQRSSPRPYLSDLKESGNLEQDADTVTLLFREEYYLQAREPKRGATEKGINLHEEWEAEYQASRDKMDAIFAKNRHGSSSTRMLRCMLQHYAVRSGSFDQMYDEPLLV